MTRYIIEKAPLEVSWIIREHGANTIVGSLTQKGLLYTAESESFRTISQGTDPVLVLRTVFRTEDFFVERDGTLHLLSPEHIRVMVGSLK